MKKLLLISVAGLLLTLTMLTTKDALAQNSASIEITAGSNDCNFSDITFASRETDDTGDNGVANVGGDRTCEILNVASIPNVTVPEEFVGTQTIKPIPASFAINGVGSNGMAGYGSLTLGTPSPFVTTTIPGIGSSQEVSMTIDVPAYVEVGNYSLTITVS